MAKTALIVWGGWNGHEPDKVAAVFERVLKEEGFGVTVADTLDAFADEQKTASYDLLVPIWTMSDIKAEQFDPINKAVQSGVGMAGCHGGMCDAFRTHTEWQFMTGGQWVAHPGNDGTEYTVKIGPERGPLNAGLNDFKVKSEQYYLHVDPAVKVWATTRFPVADGPHRRNDAFDMPQVWTKYWGDGKVFYNALGHHADVFDIPEALELMRRGFKWAAR